MASATARDPSLSRSSPALPRAVYVPTGANQLPPLVARRLIVATVAGTKLYFEYPPGLSESGTQLVRKQAERLPENRAA